MSYEQIATWFIRVAFLAFFAGIFVSLMFLIVLARRLERKLESDQADREVTRSLMSAFIKTAVPPEAKQR